MGMNAFEYLEPRSVDDAVGWLSQNPETTRVLAGGTDLLVRLKRRDWSPARVINLKRIPRLADIRDDKDWTSIGALATLDALAASPLVAKRHPVLVETVHLMASPQVRALATVGGNLCNASPAADLAPPLLVLGAELRAVGPRGARSIPITKFFAGPGRSTLAAEEILVEVRVPAAEARAAFLKFSPRKSMDLAVVSVAAANSGGSLRAAVGAAAPTPLAVPPDPAGAAAACSPIDDVRASADYRRQMVRVLLRRALERVS
jgi:carbon-monoxide dehydrogenase medium subunit